MIICYDGPTGKKLTLKFLPFSVEHTWFGLHIYILATISIHRNYKLKYCQSRQLQYAVPLGFEICMSGP